MAVSENAQPIQMNEKQEIKEILNTEHKFVTLYAINSAQNMFTYYSVQYFTLKKNFTRTNYFTIYSD